MSNPPLVFHTYFSVAVYLVEVTAGMPETGFKHESKPEANLLFVILLKFSFFNSNLASLSFVLFCFGAVIETRILCEAVLAIVALVG